MSPRQKKGQKDPTCSQTQALTLQLEPRWQQCWARLCQAGGDEEAPSQCPAVLDEGTAGPELCLYLPALYPGLQ